MARNIRLTKKNSPPITGKCDICGEMTYLPFQCRRCLGIFCDKHHLPENHSCIPISKIIKELKQFEEHTLPKSEEEEIKNKINEINRIIVSLQTMYESQEMARSEYLDKITFFSHEKDELEAKIKQLENSRAKNEKEILVNVKQVENIGKNIEKEKSSSEIQDYKLHKPDTLISYPVDKKHNDYVGNISNRTKYSPSNFFNKAKHILKSKYYRVKNWLNRRNHHRYHNWNSFFMNFIWVVILSISFLIIYSNIEKINEIILWLIPLGSAFLFVNGILWIKYIYRLLKRLNYWFKGERNWVRYLTVFMLVLFMLVLLIWQAYQQRETVFNQTIYFNKSNYFSNNFNSTKDSVSGIAVETKIKQPEINIPTLENRIHVLINEKRRQNGLSALGYDLKLVDIARKHSQDMAINNFFDHVNFNGEDPTARGLKSGYRCHKDYGSYYVDGLAENLFQNNLYDSVTYYNGIPSYDWNTLEEIAQSTVNGWMNSHGHRQNILTSTYDTEGIGVAISSNKDVLITENFC